MKALVNKAIAFVDNRVFEGIALLFVRIALADIFWRSARSKIVDGSLLQIKEEALYQFNDAPFNQVPILNGDLGAYVTTYTEHALALLVFAGLATRLGALGLLGMTLVIQIFVFPDFATWRITHMVWAAMALVLVSRGGGLFALDRLFDRRRNAANA